ncbi:MAG: hypothetical protein ACYSTJ_01485 [Planctomycetota bacterium]|jgi:hypothetical protein
MALRKGGWKAQKSLLLVGPGNLELWLERKGDGVSSQKQALTYYRLVNMVLVPGNFVKCYFDLVWHREGVIMEKEGFTMAEDGNLV